MRRHIFAERRSLHYSDNRSLNLRPIGRATDATNLPQTDQLSPKAKIVSGSGTAPPYLSEVLHLYSPRLASDISCS